jgi:hypothetical protein
MFLYYRIHTLCAADIKLFVPRICAAIPISCAVMITADHQTCSLDVTIGCDARPAGHAFDHLGRSAPQRLCTAIWRIPLATSQAPADETVVPF